MILQNLSPPKWGAVVRDWWPSSATVPLERPSLSQLAQNEAVLPAFVRNCAVAMKYLRLLGDLDWDAFPERPTNRAWPGPKPAPRAPYAAAFLVKINQELKYMSKLRDYLVEHPALVWVLGFELVPSDAYPWGFDVEASLSCPRQFGRVLRTLSNDALQFLLDGTVHLLADALPDDVQFGDRISIDTKHIIAWVRENNPKAYVTDRYDKTNQPAGDPDCKLGCKRKRNVGPDDEADTPPTPTTNPVPASGVEVSEYYWGYASGVAATKVPDWGEFVLAEFTQPFDKSDNSYFFPLMDATERRLGRRPPFGTLDAAFDAFYVYEYFHNAGGFAAVPYVARGGYPKRTFDDEGHPLCDAGLGMPLVSTYTDRSSLVAHEKGCYGCPLLHPKPTGMTCPVEHERWDHGGCATRMATSVGARIRYQLDRDSDEYKQLYNQRTATERVNSQAVELGIERPKLRNQQSITNQNTLIYVLINLRVLQRIRARSAELAEQQPVAAA